MVCARETSSTDRRTTDTPTHPPSPSSSPPLCAYPFPFLSAPARPRIHIMPSRTLTSVRPSSHQNGGGSVHAVVRISGRAVGLLLRSSSDYIVSDGRHVHGGTRAR
jgi:hypothetical protein